MSLAIPLYQPSSPLKKRMRTLLGQLLCLLRPARCRQLATAGLAHYTFLDRVMFGALMQRAEREGRLEQLQQLWWSSPSGAAYYLERTWRFDDLFLKHHRRLADELSARLALDGAAAPAVLCQIGCGSGQVLDFLAKHVSAGRYIGIDINAQQIERNRARFPALEFHAADAAAWLHGHLAADWIYYSTGGVLEYFPSETLTSLWARIAQTAGPAWVALCEPVDPAHDLEQQLSSYRFGAESTNSHNYPQQLRQAGFVIEFQAEQRIGTARFVLVLARKP